MSRSSPPLYVKPTTACKNNPAQLAGELPHGLRYQVLTKPMPNLMVSLPKLVYRAELDPARQLAPHLSNPETAHEVVRNILFASEGSLVREHQAGNAGDEIYSGSVSDMAVPPSELVRLVPRLSTDIETCAFSPAGHFSISPGRIRQRETIANVSACCFCASRCDVAVFGSTMSP